MRFKNIRRTTFPPSAEIIEDICYWLDLSELEEVFFSSDEINSLAYSDRYNYKMDKGIYKINAGGKKRRKFK